MNYREKFLNDLKCNVVIKDYGTTFADLAKLYNYPKENGANLCKKDYYKFMKACEDRIGKITDYVPANNEVTRLTRKVDDNTYEYLTLKSKWEVQTKGGGKDVLKSYINNISAVDVKRFREDLIKDIKELSLPKSFTFPAYVANTNNVLVISIPDYHVGRKELTTDLYDNYLLSIYKILSKVDIKTIERVVYVIGNDFFNSDNISYTTTRGTQQFDYNTWKETWDFGKQLILSSITLLKSYDVFVDVMCVPGNHDQQKIFYLTDVLQGYYANDQQVNIINNPELFKKYVYGSSLIVFEHGEMKHDDYPLIVASEFPEDWGNSKHRYVFCGHLHHTIVKEYRGNVTVKFLPSLAANSEWEKSRGYKTSPKAEGNVINKVDGLVDTIIINF